MGREREKGKGKGICRCSLGYGNVPIKYEKSVTGSKSKGGWRGEDSAKRRKSHSQTKQKHEN